MSTELRPIPILKGKTARKFYRDINTGEITSDQKKFLSKCKKLLQESKIE
jgi:hypothetical protein